MGPGFDRGESTAKEAGKVGGVTGLVPVAHSDGDVVGVGCVDVGGIWAVRSEEVEQGGGEHRPLRDPTPDDSPPRRTRLVEASGSAAPQIGSQPPYNIGVEGAIAEFIEERGVVDRVESLGVIYCYCRGSDCWLWLIEALGDACSQWEEGGGRRVDLFEAVLGWVLGQGLRK